MDADPTGSSAQSPAIDSDHPDKVNKADEDDPKQATNDATSTSTGAPAEKVRVQLPLSKAEDIVPCPPNASPRETFTSGISSWAKNLKLPQQDSKAVTSGRSAFARFTSELGLHLPTKSSDEPSDSKSPSSQVGDALELLTKAVVDSSRSAVKAVQVKARHMVSQNKRRYQEGEFDLDMTYITENIIAMGFPAGDLSSGLFGFFEGLYRNHMEEVIKFFETHHKGKYKVYNLCSERLYDASRFEGKVASFPFEDHNCPPLQLIPSFCQSAYSWLKEDIQNVVAVHCKAGMARTGLMICCLLLYLKFFPTAEEAIEYYNQKRCVDGKALVLPSQIRYVKYYERVQNNYKGEAPAGRRCMLRGFRLINCPYWIRPSITISNHSGLLFSTRKHPKTKDLMPEDFWIKAPRKGVVVFALPGEPGLTELAGDFKVHFHQSDGDFYCWLNTTMAENRTMLNGASLDGFEKRKVPAPAFHVEIVMVDLASTLPLPPQPAPSLSNEHTADSDQTKAFRNTDEDVFSDSDDDNDGSGSSNPRDGSKQQQPHTGSVVETETPKTKSEEKEKKEDSVNTSGQDEGNVAVAADPTGGHSDFKAIAADTSVFSFGDEEEDEEEDY